MGYNGATFTWDNCCRNDSNIKERLDRFLCSKWWDSLFLDTVISHLIKFSFDHLPITIHSDGADFPYVFIKKLSRFEVF